MRITVTTVKGVLAWMVSSDFVQAQLQYFHLAVPKYSCIVCQSFVDLLVCLKSLHSLALSFSQQIACSKNKLMLYQSLRKQSIPKRMDCLPACYKIHVESSVWFLSDLTPIPESARWFLANLDEKLVYVLMSNGLVLSFSCETQFYLCFCDSEIMNTDFCQIRSANLWGISLGRGEGINFTSPMILCCTLKMILSQTVSISSLCFLLWISGTPEL